MSHHPPVDSAALFTQEFWDARYGATDQVWSGNPNPRLVEHGAELTPGTALSVFVATSVSVGIVAVTGQHVAWIPIALGLVGAGLLFHPSLLLIAESRVGFTAIGAEMEFLARLGRPHAPSELLQRPTA